jgi:hypothetical protein
MPFKRIQNVSWMIALLAVALQQETHQVVVSACPLEVWAYDSYTSCQNYAEPIARGLINADGTCRTTDVIQDSVNGQAATYLPGTYTATCVPIEDETSFDEYHVRFSESGCVSEDCAPDPEGDLGVCERNWSSMSVLYSLLPPSSIIPVTDLDFAAIGGRRCLGFVVEGSIALTLAVYGDCNCDIATPAPSTGLVATMSPTLSPIIQPTGAPIVTQSPTSSTTAPTLLPTYAPSLRTTPSPSSRPTLAAIPSVVVTNMPSASLLSATSSPTQIFGQEPIGVVNDILSPKPTIINVGDTTAMPTDDGTDTTSQDAGSSQMDLVDRDEGPSSREMFIAAMIAGIGAILCCCSICALTLSRRQRQHKSTVPIQSTTPPSSTPPEISFEKQMNEEVSTIGEPIGHTPSATGYPVVEERTVTPEGPFFASPNDEGTIESVYTSGTDDLRISKDDGSLEGGLFVASLSPTVESHIDCFEVRAPPGPLGILVHKHNGRLCISSLKVNSVLTSKGVKVGDYFLSVDDTNVERLSPVQCSEIVRSKAEGFRTLKFQRISTGHHNYYEEGDSNRIVC